MDKVIVTALLVIGAVTAAVVSIMWLVPAVSISSQATASAAQEASSRILTSIEIIAVASNSEGTTVDAWVKNVGAAPILGIAKSDVFIITPGTRYDAMTHAASGDNSWTEQPPDSAWNRGDTLHMSITLAAGAPLALGDHSLRISTPNGVIAEKFFSR